MEIPKNVCRSSPGLGGQLTHRLRLPGKPLTDKNALLVLLENGVTVGFGVQEKWMARNLRFDLAWACIRGKSLFFFLPAHALF